MKYIGICLALLLSASAVANDKQAVVVQKNKEYYVIVPSCKLEEKVTKVWMDSLRKNSQIRLKTETETKHCKIKEIIKTV